MFAGRKRESAPFRAVLDGVVAREPALVVVTGPAGIGKSALIDHCLSSSGHQLHVIRTSAADLARPEGQAPVRLIGRALRAVVTGDVAERLAIALAGPGEHGEHDAAVVAALRAATRTAPVVVLVDAAQHLDEPTLNLLARMLGFARDCSVLVVLAVTAPGAGGMTVERLLNHPFPVMVSTLALPPLADEDCAEIAADAAGLAPAQAERVGRLAHGNPLLARELAFALSGNPPRGSTALAAHAMFAQRVRDLRDGDRLPAVLPTLSLLGRPATVSLLAQVCDTDPATVEQALTRAMGAGLVERQGRLGKYALAHPWIAQAAVADLGPQAVQGLHLALARALDTPATGPGSASAASSHRTEVARHFVAAGIGGDEVARACLDAARWEESTHTFEAAEELAVYGLDAGGEDPAVQLGLLRLLGRCHGRAHRLAAAREVFDRALTLARATGGGRALVKTVIDLLTYDQDFVTSRPLPQELLEQALEEETDSALYRSVLLARLAATLWADDPPRSRALVQEAWAEALESGDTDALVTALESGVQLARMTRALPEFTARAQWLRGRGSPSSVAPVASTIALPLARADRAAFDYALARAGTLQAQVPLARTRGLLTLAALTRAVMDADGAQVQRLREEAQADPGGDIRVLAAVLDLVWTFVTGEQREVSQDVVVAALPTPALAGTFVLAAAAVAHYYQRPGATQWLESLAGVGVDDIPDLVADVAVALQGYVGAALDDPQTCRTTLDALQGHEDEIVVLAGVVGVGPVGFFLSWAHAGTGDLDAALDANARGEGAARRAGAPLWVAHLQLQRARLLRERDQTAAVRAAGQARDLAEQHAVPALVALVDDFLAGLPKGPLAPGGRSYQVLALAAKGLTNEQIARELFLSVSTVERHFTLIYRGLGVRNRAEAVAALLGGQNPAGGSSMDRGA